MTSSGTGKAPQDIWDVVIIGLGTHGIDARASARPQGPESSGARARAAVLRQRPGGLYRRRMHADLPGRGHRERARRRHDPRLPRAMGAEGRFRTRPAQAVRSPQWLDHEQLLLPALSRNPDGGTAVALSECHGAARPRRRRVRPGGGRGHHHACGKRRRTIWTGARGRAVAAGRKPRARALARRLRRRPQLRPRQSRHQDEREKLSRAVAGRRHQGEGRRRTASGTSPISISTAIPRDPRCRVPSPMGITASSSC